MTDSRRGINNGRSKVSKSTSRHTTVVQGLMAEVALGGALLVWLNQPDAADRALFGRVMSEAVLIAAMVALAAAMAALIFAARLGRVVLRICVLVVSLVVAGVGALAVGGLFSDLGGPWILLAMAWVFGVVLIVSVSRESARLRRVNMAE